MNAVFEALVNGSMVSTAMTFIFYVSGEDRRANVVIWVWWAMLAFRYCHRFVSLFVRRSPIRPQRRCVRIMRQAPDAAATPASESSRGFGGERSSFSPADSFR